MYTFQLLLCSCFIGIILFERCGSRDAREYEANNLVLRTKNATARTEEEIKLWFLQQALQCAKDYPVTGEEILLLEEHKIPDSRNAKCLLSCMFKKTEWMDDKGMFIEENAVKMSEREHPDDPAKVENAKKLFDLCKKVNEEAFSGPDSECERAASLAKCLSENAPTMGFELKTPT